MKILSISILSLFSCINSLAQTNFYKLGMGAGLGLTQSFADVANENISKSVYGSMDYFFTPFLSLGGELQAGTVKGGNAATDANEREFVNSYKSATINGKLYLGALIDLDRNWVTRTMRWAYAGGGAGVIRNRMKKIARVKKSSGYRFPGKNSSNELVIPLNVGISYFFNNREDIPRLSLNVNLQSNITLGEGLDGYDDSTLRFKSGTPDIYNFYSFGLRYRIGVLGVYKKNWH